MLILLTQVCLGGAAPLHGGFVIFTGYNRSECFRGRWFSLLSSHFAAPSCESGHLVCALRSAPCPPLVEGGRVTNSFSFHSPVYPEQAPIFC